MSFEQEPTRTPAAIGNIVVTLKDAPEVDEFGAYQAAYFDVKIELSDGTIVNRSGNLVPRITTAQRDALMSFMDSLRVQAENQIL